MPRVKQTMDDGADMSSITNAVLSAKQDALSAQVGELKSAFVQFSQSYTRSDVLELQFKEIDLKIAAINQLITSVQLEIAKMNKKRGMQTWLTGTFSATAGIVLALLVQFYLSNVRN